MKIKVGDKVETIDDAIIGVVTKISGNSININSEYGGVTLKKL